MKRISVLLKDDQLFVIRKLYNVAFEEDDMVIKKVYKTTKQKVNYKKHITR